MTDFGKSVSDVMKGFSNRAYDLLVDCPYCPPNYADIVVDAAASRWNFPNTIGPTRPDGKVQNGPYNSPMYNTLHYPSGRSGVVDNGQPVFGYFGGGGWTFGAVEHHKYKTSYDTFVRYRNAKSSEKFTIVSSYRASVPGLVGAYETKTKTVEVIIGRDIPTYEDLIYVDKMSFHHDAELARVREGGISFFLDGSIDAELFNSSKSAYPRSEFPIENPKTGTVAGDDQLHANAEYYRQTWLHSDGLKLRPGWSTEKLDI